MDPTQLTRTNANEFVCKLFKMLREPEHQDVARWGKNGDTFIVVEGERFTRSILAKHFKHSNMASFVRQLNKYDFHKVKPPVDASGSTSTSNMLEFKHPYFRADRQNDLDNIRRKAPVPRKTQMIEEFITSQFVGVISEQLAATQQQVQQLQDRFAEVSGANRCLFNQVLALRKSINAQKAAQHEILNYLVISDARINGNTNHPTASTGIMVVSDGDESPPELRKSRELLTGIVTAGVMDCEMEELHDANVPPADPSVTDSLVSQTSPVSPATVTSWYDPITDLVRYPVYPVGQTVGIDPFASEHMQNLPYALPGSAPATNKLEEPHREAQQEIPKASGLYRTIETTTVAPQWPLTPIIAMTSSSRPDEINQYFEYGLPGVLAKPFTKEGILQSLKTHLPHLLRPLPQAETDDTVIKPAIEFMNDLVPVRLGQRTTGSVHSWLDNDMQQTNVGRGYSMDHAAIEFDMGGRIAY
ncbi:hypothetical protein NQ176_g717 [Zarea fungicola]|uniref:Uncharacterized protein n=1 Tax=Zarea fungicola TaxID=93591 RepID=A0ACC1NX77_9HYPO|nr:hypothetical protein NQ176_g717 [Lecanicillium fungicola]